MNNNTKFSSINPNELKEYISILKTMQEPVDQEKIDILKQKIASKKYMNTSEDIEILAKILLKELKWKISC